MKKIMMLLAATMLLLGVNGQAMAYFSNGDLIQVVYSGATEIATDEGSLATLLAGGTTLNFSSPLANANVAYFDYITTGGALGTMWTSGGASQTGKGGSAGAFITAYNSAAGLYFNAGTQQVTVATSNPSSYYATMDSNGGGVGQMAGFIPAGGSEASLVNNGPVQQTLYSYVPTSRTNPTGVFAATINTGNTATPVPPSILLMGSGLLGLAGIGRKKTV
jgi:hypothetical protein